MTANTANDTAKQKAREVMDEARATAKSVADSAARAGKDMMQSAERTAETARETAADVAEAAKDGAADAKAALDKQSGGLMSQAKETLGAAAQTGRDVFEAARAGIADVTAATRDAIASQMEGKAEAGKQMLVEQGQKIAGQISEAARAVGKTATQSQILDTVATGVSDLSQTLRNRSVQGVMKDMRGFVRRNPGVAVAGAAVVGFAIARVAMSRSRSGAAETVALIEDQAHETARDVADAARQV